METLFDILEALPTWFVVIDGLLIALLAAAALTPTKKDDAILDRVKNIFDKLRSLLVNRDPKV
jgi:hypothetical protein